MPNEQQEHQVVAQRERLKPFAVGGEPDFFPKGQELNELLAGRRTKEKSPTLFPHLPSEAYWLLLLPYLSYFSLQDQMAIEQGKKLKTEAPVFTPGMVQLGDILGSLVNPKAKITKSQRCFFAQSRLYPLYPNSILYTMALRTSATLSLFPTPVRFVKNDRGNLETNLTGLSRADARDSLSHKGFDSAKILEKAFKEDCHPPYLALETQHWIYHVYLVDDRLILSLRHVDPAKNLRVFEAKPANLLYGPNGLPHTDKDYEKRFEGLCQQLIKHTKNG